MQIHNMETEHCFEGGSRVASIFFGVTSQEASCMCPFWGHYLLLGRLEVCQTQLLLYLIWELGMKQSRPGFGWWPHSFHRLSPFRWKVTVVPVLVLMAEANIQSGPLDWTWSTLLYVLRWLICSWDFIGVFFSATNNKDLSAQLGQSWPLKIGSLDACIICIASTTQVSHGSANLMGQSSGKPSISMLFACAWLDCLDCLLLPTRNLFLVVYVSFSAMMTNFTFCRISKVLILHEFAFPLVAKKYQHWDVQAKFTSQVLKRSP